MAIVPGGVKFTGDHRLGMRVNLESRIASRVLRAIHDAPYRDEHDLNAIAAGIDWAAWFSPECTIKVELVAQRSPLRSLEFTTLRIKDAICDRFRDETGERPSIDTSTPDVRINVFCDERDATFYLDTSGEALFKRGWRLDKVAAPLRENLAAGLIALAGWTADKPLLDPFCGSGTIPVEAAHIAFGRAPGLEREFAFRHLAGFDGKVWDALLADARARINDEADARIFGGDISIAALPAAKANAERAGVEIEWRQIDARQAEPPTAEPGLILCNPPYGERIHVRGRPVEQEDGDDREFFEEFGRALKERFTGWRVAILSSDPNIVGKLRLKPSRSIALFNGALACKLHIFEIHANSGADFDAEEAKALGNRLVEDDADVEDSAAEDDVTVESVVVEGDLSVEDNADEATAAPPATEAADHETDPTIAPTTDPEVPQSPADVDADAGTPPAGADADAESDPTPAGPEAHDQR
nr:THUMP domain-containing protein [Derxia gummosa]